MWYNVGIGSLAQLARAPRLHRGGQGFEPLATHHFMLESAILAVFLIRSSGRRASQAEMTVNRCDLLIGLINKGPPRRVAWC